MQKTQLIFKVPSQGLNVIQSYELNKEGNKEFPSTRQEFGTQRNWTQNL